MNNVILVEVEVRDLITFLDRKNKKFQATLLSDVENEIGKGEEYKRIRKAILDSSNNYLRLVIKTIFGDVEIG